MVDLPRSGYTSLTQGRDGGLQGVGRTDKHVYEYYYLHMLSVKHWLLINCLSVCVSFFVMKCSVFVTRERSVICIIPLTPPDPTHQTVILAFLLLPTLPRGSAEKIMHKNQRAYLYH